MFQVLSNCLFVLIVAVVPASYSEIGECTKKNEVYDGCRKNCEPTCDSMNQPCTLICVAGCVCDKGFVRNTADECVALEECFKGNSTSDDSSKCLKQNEVFSDCSKGCEASCDNPDPICNFMCNPGCVCATGLLRNEAGDCVAPDKCPLKYPDVLPKDSDKCLKQNEVFSDCSKGCEASCDNPDPICNLMCNPGCVCATGLLRNKAGDCVSPEKCLLKYPDDLPVGTDSDKCLNQNEVFSDCSKGCEASCDNPDPICNFICNPGCVCASGLLRNKAGDCVAPDKCPLKYPDDLPPDSNECSTQDEVYSVCSKHCEPTCANPHPRICTLMCSAGCVCARGLVRASDGYCVPPAQCRDPFSPSVPFYSIWKPQQTVP